MPKQKSMKVNFIVNGCRIAFNTIFPIIVFPYVSRILLLDGIGRVEFPTSIVSYFIMLANLGIPLYGIRECAKVRDDKQKLTKVFQEIAIINIFSMIISYILFFIAIFSVPKLYETKELLLIISSSIVFNTIGVEWLYQAMEEYTYISIRSIVFKLLTIVGIFLFIHTENDYMIYAVLMVFANVGSNILNVINARRFVSFRRLREYNLKRHIKPIMTLFTMALAISVYANLDIVMLGFLKGDDEVALYTAAIKMSRVIITIVTSLGAVLLPRISYYIEHNLREEFLKLTTKSMDFVVLVALPCIVFLFVFADKVIYLLAGSAFMDAAPTMKILLPIILAIGVSNLIGVQILIPLGKEKITLYSVILGAVVNFIMDFILIPKYAQNGAAVSILTAEVCVALYQIYYAKSYLKRGVVFKNVFKYIIAGFLMLVAALLANRLLNYDVFIILIISIGVSFIVYIVTILCFKDEIVYDMFIKVLRRNKLKGDKNV